MRRSEARNIIKEILLKNTKGIDGYPSSDTAQAILNALEDAGMMPPLANLKKNSFTTNMRDNPYAYDDSRVGFEWEPENE